MELLIVILSILLAKKIVDTLGYLVNANPNGVITQIVTWAVGVLMVFFAIWAQVPSIPGDVWPRILWGVWLGSAASTVHDLFKALATAWSPHWLLPPRTAATSTIATQP